MEDLGDGTFAIGEPRYCQQNYSYLIVGQTRAILFDSGAGTFIYPTTLYAFLPGASLSAATARMLLGMLPADTVLWTTLLSQKCRHVGAVVVDDGFA